MMVDEETLAKRKAFSQSLHRPKDVHRYVKRILVMAENIHFSSYEGMCTNFEDLTFDAVMFYIDNDEGAAVDPLYNTGETFSSLRKKVIAVIRHYETHGSEYDYYIPEEGE